MKYKDLLMIQCEDNTSPMAVYLYNNLKNLGQVTFDPAGNLWFSRGIAMYYPLIVAHMDTVQNVNFAKQFIEANGIVSGLLGANPTGIGADDKNGIYIACKLIEKTTIPLKCLFTFGEETGGTGSMLTTGEYFTDIAYMLQFDRKGSGDIIDYGSDDFLADVSKIGKKYGYQECMGLFTDVTILSSKHEISAVNLSCGYHNAHTDKEYTVLAELVNATKFGIELITKLSKVYPYEQYHQPTLRQQSHNIEKCECCGSFSHTVWNEDYWGWICSDCLRYFSQPYKHPY